MRGILTGTTDWRFPEQACKAAPSGKSWSGDERGLVIRGPCS
ncbi:hypothetical protein NIT7321_01561 [Phaeobacter italicus]|uniref:Uncharacterized protein n=1 Tax=Phaeobacter italicus TaxID=481446 RepID=A0A0H5D117_9RHOB|nr:hypothetical protein NIT7321_01561 [Phaeobacter italicus]